MQGRANTMGAQNSSQPMFLISLRRSSIYENGGALGEHNPLLIVELGPWLGQFFPISVKLPTADDRIDNLTRLQELEIEVLE